MFFNRCCNVHQFPQPESATWFFLFLESFEDTTIIVLIIAAIVSLAVGLYEDRQKGWIEGAAIIVAILVVAFVTSGNNFEKEVRRFNLLSSLLYLRSVCNILCFIYRSNSEN